MVNVSNYSKTDHDVGRNPTYLEHSRLYAQAVFQSGALLKLTPSILHPLIAPFLVRPVVKHRKICMNLSVPIIKQRMQDMENLGSDFEPHVCNLSSSESQTDKTPDRCSSVDHR